MKAILEGTAEEFRQLFGGNAKDLTPIIKSHEDVSERSETPENVPKRSKTPENVHKRIKNTSQAHSIDDILIPAFDHDRKLNSTYKRILFTESDDGKVALSYSGTKLYANREKVLQIPCPVPHGYFGRVKSGTPANRVTAIRFYRAYLAEQTPEQKGKPVFQSGKNGMVILNKFTEAERFDYSSLTKSNIGPVICYENGDGRVALKYYGHGDIVFVAKEQIAILKKMDKSALNKYLSEINAAKQFLLKKFIEEQKDIDIGAVKFLKTETRPPKD